MTSSSTERSSFWFIILAIFFGNFMAILSSTTINVAFPIFMKDFDAELGKVQWMITGFLLATGVVAPIVGYFGDRFSYKRLYIFALSGFTLFAALCTLAWSIDSLIIFRILQGVFSGLIIPTKLLLNLPIGIAAVVVAFKCLPYQSISSSKTFDFPGFITVLLSSSFIILSFTEGNGWGWTNWKTLFFFFVGVAALIYFIRRELRIANPLLNLSVFRTSRFTYSLIINCIITASLYSGTLLIPVFVQDVQHSTPLVTALILLPGSMVMALCSPIVGKLYSRTGPFPLIMGGILLLIVSNWELSHISLHATHVYAAGWMTIRYIGISLAFMPVMNAGMSSISKEKSGHASSVTNWVRQAVGALSIGVFSSLLAARSLAHQKDVGVDASASSSFIRDQGMTLAVQDVFLIAVFICIVAIPLSFILREKRNKRRTVGLQG